MVNSVSAGLSPYISQLLNPGQSSAVTNPPAAAAPAATGSSTSTPATGSTGQVLPQSSGVALNSNILNLLQGNDSSNSSDPLLSLLGGNTSTTDPTLSLLGDTAGGSVSDPGITSLYNNLLSSIVNASVTEASDNTAAQQAANKQASTDPLQKVLANYSQAVNNPAAADANDPVQAVINAYNNAVNPPAASSPSQQLTA